MKIAAGRESYGEDVFTEMFLRIKWLARVTCQEEAAVDHKQLDHLIFTLHLASESNRSL